MSAILSDSEQSSVMDSPPTTKKKRETQPTCSLCKIHNLKILSSAHKGRCLGLYCICSKCEDKKQSRNKSKEDTKKDRQKKKEQERQARIKLIGSELIKAEPKQDIIPFIIPEEDKEKLPKDIDEDMLKTIKFVKKREEIIFTGQRERKRKEKIDEEDSSEKRLKLDFPFETISINKFKDLLRYGLCICLGCDMRDNIITTMILSWIDEMVAITLECSSSKGTEKSSDEAKSRMFLASIIRHMKIIQRTITWNVISFFLNVHLIYYLLLFIYCLFPT
ncbi:uncharacterized protein LOC105252031 isoform X2 [Camponotus floridanus]|nr:uncharacterized protein LOC105252031 isoform X2 [Camponotus floridanus]